MTSSWSLILQLSQCCTVQYTVHKANHILTNFSPSTHYNSILLTSSYIVSDKRCTEYQYTHFVFSDSSEKSYRLWDNVKWYGSAGEATGDIIRRKCISCWINTTALTHLEYAILVSIIIQQYATIFSLFISVNCSTCFGWDLHPSSGTHITATTASGINETVTAILLLKCDGTSPETKFCFSAKWMSPFKLAGASVQSTTDSRGVRVSGINAGYTMFRGSVMGTGYPLNSSVSLSLPLPCVTVSHHLQDRSVPIQPRSRQVAVTVMPDVVDTVLWAPDDGWRYRQKHVE